MFIETSAKTGYNVKQVGVVNYFPVKRHLINRITLLYPPYKYTRGYYGLVVDPPRLPQMLTDSFEI
jgi:hypothetical protein